MKHCGIVYKVTFLTSNVIKENESGNVTEKVITGRYKPKRIVIVVWVYTYNCNFYKKKQANS